MTVIDNKTVSGFSVPTADTVGAQEKPKHRRKSHHKEESKRSHKEKKSSHHKDHDSKHKDKKSGKHSKRSKKEDIDLLNMTPGPYNGGKDEPYSANKVDDADQLVRPSTTPARSRPRSRGPKRTRFEEVRSPRAEAHLQTRVGHDSIDQSSSSIDK